MDSKQESPVILRAPRGPARGLDSLVTTLATIALRLASEPLASDRADDVESSQQEQPRKAA